jgi:hypothetical protein
MLETMILSVVVHECETWSLAVREIYSPGVFGNKVLRRIIGPRRNEGTGEWRKQQNEELRNLHSSPSVIRMIKLKRRIHAGFLPQMRKRLTHIY